MKRLKYISLKITLFFLLMWKIIATRIKIRKNMKSMYRDIRYFDKTMSKDHTGECKFKFNNGETLKYIRGKKLTYKKFVKVYHG